jgi:hypothetical protein
LRKIIKTRGSFPNDDAALKLLYLAIKNAGMRWRRGVEQASAMGQFAIQFGTQQPAHGGFLHKIPDIPAQDGDEDLRLPHGSGHAINDRDPLPVHEHLVAQPDGVLEHDPRQVALELAEKSQQRQRHSRSGE